MYVTKSQCVLQLWEASVKVGRSVTQLSIVEIWYQACGAGVFFSTKARPYPLNTIKHRNPKSEIEMRATLKSVTICSMIFFYLCLAGSLASICIQTTNYFLWYKTVSDLHNLYIYSHLRYHTPPWKFDLRGTRTHYHRVRTHACYPLGYGDLRGEVNVKVQFETGPKFLIRISAWSISRKR